MISKIKVGICIAYDWEMLKLSLPIVYNEVDTICLSLDIDRKTWAGNTFDFDSKSFYKYVNEIDTQNKIIIYEDDFFIDTASTMKNEVYQRNKMAEKLGKGGWHIQIDVDEYFTEIKSFVNFLKKKHDFLKNKDINICLPIYTMFKKTNHGFFFVKGKPEWFSIATNNPSYSFGRRNGYFNLLFDSPIIHQSWAREESEILQKIKNWGHKDDFDTQSFFRKWKSLSVQNYLDWENFHPIEEGVWEKLILIKGDNIQDLIKDNKLLQKLKSYSKLEILLKNNKVFSKIMQLLRIKW